MAVHCSGVTAKQSSMISSAVDMATSVASGKLTPFAMFSRQTTRIAATVRIGVADPHPRSAATSSASVVMLAIPLPSEMGKNWGLVLPAVAFASVNHTE